MSLKMGKKIQLISNLTELEGGLTGRLISIYGDKDGVRSSSVLVPAILQDFSGMIDKADIGESVSEIYRTEDGKAEIILQTVKSPGGSTVRAEVRKM